MNNNEQISRTSLPLPMLDSFAEYQKQLQQQMQQQLGLTPSTMLNQNDIMHQLLFANCKRNNSFRAAGEGGRCYLEQQPQHVQGTPQYSMFHQLPAMASHQQQHFQMSQVPPSSSAMTAAQIHFQQPQQQQQASPFVMVPPQLPMQTSQVQFNAPFLGNYQTTDIVNQLAYLNLNQQPLLQQSQQQLQQQLTSSSNNGGGGGAAPFYSNILLQQMAHNQSLINAMNNSQQTNSSLQLQSTQQNRIGGGGGGGELSNLMSPPPPLSQQLQQQTVTAQTGLPSAFNQSNIKSELQRVVPTGSYQEQLLLAAAAATTAQFQQLPVTLPPLSTHQQASPFTMVVPSETSVNIASEGGGRKPTNCIELSTNTAEQITPASTLDIKSMQPLPKQLQLREIASTEIVVLDEEEEEVDVEEEEEEVEGEQMKLGKRLQSQLERVDETRRQVAERSQLEAIATEQSKQKIASKKELLSNDRPGKGTAMAECENQYCYGRGKRILAAMSKRFKPLLYKLCNECCDWFQQGFHCDYCEQIYENNESCADMKEWVGCENCPKWNHVDCEATDKNDSKIKRVYKSKEFKYYCPRCFTDESRPPHKTAKGTSGAANGNGLISSSHNLQIEEEGGGSINQKGLKRKGKDDYSELSFDISRAYKQRKLDEEDFAVAAAAREVNDNILPTRKKYASNLAQLYSFYLQPHAGEISLGAKQILSDECIRSDLEQLRCFVDEEYKQKFEAKQKEEAARAEEKEAAKRRKEVMQQQHQEILKKEKKQQPEDILGEDQFMSEDEHSTEQQKEEEEENEDEDEKKKDITVEAAHNEEEQQEEEQERDGKQRRRRQRGVQEHNIKLDCVEEKTEGLAQSRHPYRSSRLARKTGRIIDGETIQTKRQKRVGSEKEIGATKEGEQQEEEEGASDNTGSDQTPATENKKYGARRSHSKVNEIASSSRAMRSKNSGAAQISQTLKGRGKASHISNGAHPNSAAEKGGANLITTTRSGRTTIASSMKH